MTSHAPVRTSEFCMAIRQILDADAVPAGVVDVRLRRRNGEDWHGRVHVFEISGHPRARRCYAWPEPLDASSIVIRVVPQAGRIAAPEQAVRSILNRRAR
jgi:hypothetical protein